MSEDFVKNVLKAHAEANVPPQADVWPALREQVRRGNSAYGARPSISWRPLALGGALALLLVLLAAASLLALPAPVSAEEILAKAEQVAKENTTAGLQNFYGDFVSLYRNNANVAFYEQRQETWFQAPDQYAYKITYDLESGESYTLANGTDATHAYQYRGDRNLIQVLDKDTSSLQLPGEPSTSTLQVLLFSPTSLAEMLERARQKTSPPLSPKSEPRPPYKYDAKVVGEEEVVGRRTYVIELTFVPGASVQTPESQIPEKMKMWIDKEIYAILRYEGWDGEGRVLRSGIYESFRINDSAPIDILSVMAPPDADMVLLDFVDADNESIEQEWRIVARQAPYQLFEPSTLPDGLTRGRPLYDTRRGVTSQLFTGEVKVKTANSNSEWKLRPREESERSTSLPRLAIIQGPPASIKEDMLGASTAVQAGNITGRFYTVGIDNILVFDREGTRIKLYALAAGDKSAFTSSELVSIAETMQPLAVK
ncbi:MAG: outer membrane lipoprotein-sorting protein [Chloroflexia bacterium]